MLIIGSIYIMKMPNNKTVRLNSNLDLVCQAEGSPENITHSWFKYGHKIKKVFNIGDYVI